MDLASWEVIQTVPTIGFLSLCYLFMVDVKSHYVAQDGSISTLNISYYITIVKTALDNFIVWLNA